MVLFELFRQNVGYENESMQRNPFKQGVTGCLVQFVRSRPGLGVEFALGLQKSF